jgi:hypothetical protein
MMAVPTAYTAAAPTNACTRPAQQRAGLTSHQRHVRAPGLAAQTAYSVSRSIDLPASRPGSHAKGSSTERVRASLEHLRRP